MLRISSRRFRVAIAGVSALALLCFGGISSAAAASLAGFNLPANSSTTVRLSGTLAVTAGTESTKCTFVNTPVSASNSASMQGGMTAVPNGPTETTCANGGKFSFTFLATATKEGAAFTLSNYLTGSGAPAKNPFASSGSAYASSAYSMPYVNGAGAVASKLVFNETSLGTTLWSGFTMKATGELSVRKSDGSLLVLS